QRLVPDGRLSALRESDDGFSITGVLSRGQDEIRLAIVTWPKQSFDAWWKENRERFSASVAPSGPFVLPAIEASECAGDTWAQTALDVPDMRSRHTAVWTGTEMIVWGGRQTGDSPFLDSGGRYNPATDTWVPTSRGVGVPVARVGHTATWTGSEMIVWG